MTERSTPGRRRERRGRLSRSAEFDRVYRNGRSHGNRYLVLYAFPAEQRSASKSEAAFEESRRLGVSVARKVGGAVERNRVKRLLREAFWAESDRVADDHDYVIVARPEARALGERDGLEGIRRELGELMDKLGNSSDPASEESP